MPCIARSLVVAMPINFANVLIPSQCNATTGLNHTNQIKSDPKPNPFGHLEGDTICFRAELGPMLLRQLVYRGQMLTKDSICFGLRPGCKGLDVRIALL